MGLVLWCSVAAGYEGVAREPSPAEKAIEALPRTAEESETLWEFFSERTRLGVGFDETLNDNYFLKDNDKAEEYISTLEAEIFFADPRGTLLYGADWEFNAIRYHRMDANTVDHDALAFIDLDSGGRFQYRLNYWLDVDNTLVFGPEKVDIIRRGTDFQRIVSHEGNAKVRYALNETNALVPQLDYEVIDHQIRDDATQDRRLFKAIVDLDHDLKPGWVLFGGYEYDRTFVPGSKLRGFTSHGIRGGTRYELTSLVNLNALVEFERTEENSGKKSHGINFSGAWGYQAGPRTKLSVGYVTERKTSYAAGRTLFRTTRPSAAVLYELTPLVDVKAGAHYERQDSDKIKISRLWGLSAGVQWNFREKSHFTVDYGFRRSKTGDYTNHVWTFGFETEL